MTTPPPPKDTGTCPASPSPRTTLVGQVYVSLGLLFADATAEQGNFPHGAPNAAFVSFPFGAIVAGRLKTLRRICLCTHQFTTSNYSAGKPEEGGAKFVPIIFLKL